MIDLNSSYKEAVENIQKWFSRYTSEEYPHKIVLNIMYRAYTMETLYKEYEDGTLPHFNDLNSSLLESQKMYSLTALTKVRDNLLHWLNSRGGDYVGTVCFNKLERLATKAENDKKALEELEFTYLFEYLNDKCSLFWLGLTLAGQSQTQAIGLITGYMIENIPSFNYEISKNVFQQLRVGKYMNDNYIPFSH